MSKKLYNGSHNLGVSPAPGRKLPIKVFVVGTGRSGTHWLARSLRDSGFSCSMEAHLATANNIVLYNRRFLWPKLIDRLREDKRIVDKSHVLLWEVEKLAEEFPDALFIAIKREKAAIVRSMLRHPEVRAWCANFRRLNIPFPNRMLGCDSAKRYESKTLEQRCALRCSAHIAEINRLETMMPKDRWLTVQYENLEAYAPRLKDFLGCNENIKIETRLPRH